MDFTNYLWGKSGANYRNTQSSLIRFQKLKCLTVTIMLMSHMGDSTLDKHFICPVSFLAFYLKMAETILFLSVWEWCTWIPLFLLRMAHIYRHNSFIRYLNCQIGLQSLDYQLISVIGHYINESFSLLPTKK